MAANYCVGPMSPFDGEKEWPWSKDAIPMAERLAADPRLVALTSDRRDVERFMCVELASFIDIRFGESIEPSELQADEVIKAEWTRRALGPAGRIYNPHSFGRCYYWIRDPVTAETVGTIGFWCPYPSPPTIEICSLYVRPTHRRRGWAGTMLKVFRDAAFAVGFDRVILEAEWNNQVGLNFYLDQGMWVSQWKRSIRLYFEKGMPAWTLDVAGDRADFRGDGRVLGTAYKNGDQVRWDPAQDTPWALVNAAESTLAVKLALMNWPLIEDHDRWQKLVDAGWSHGGGPTELALRIRGYEREIRKQGWKLPLPRNPSFAALPRIVNVAAQHERLAVMLSDESVRYVSLDYIVDEPSVSDAVQRVEIDLDIDAVVAILRSGERRYVGVEQILRLTGNETNERRSTVAPHAAAIEEHSPVPPEKGPDVLAREDLKALAGTMEVDKVPRR